MTELSLESQIGDTVSWKTLGGEEFSGTLIAWDNGTAIVRLADGTEKAVRAS